MRFAFLARITVPAVLAIGAWLAGPSALPVLAAEACATPTLSAVIDTDGSGPMSPRIVLTAEALVLPAQGRFEWGDGQFGVARLADGDSATGVVTFVQPIYATPGTYTLELVVTDACASSTSLAVAVTVPMLLPPPATIACPTPVDATGFCVVESGAVSTFTVSGVIAAAPWRWNGPSPDGPSDAGSHRLRADDAGPVPLQAATITPSGWLVTPVLQVIGIPPARPRITTFSDPLAATADQPFDIGFTVPAGSEGGVASILIDDVKVADGATAAVRLGAGSHTITYVVADLDGGTMHRQVIVLVSPPPPPMGLLAIAVLLLLVASAARSIMVRRPRRDRTVPDRDAPPPPLVSLPRGTTP